MSTAAADISTGDRLSFTFFIAIAVHAMLIFGIGFTIDSGPKIAPTLNITIATHKSQAPPEKADFIAQHNQQASGTIDEVKELTVREVAEIQDVRIRDISPNPEIKASQKSEISKRVVTTQNASTQKINTQTKSNENQQKEDRKGEVENAPVLSPEFASLQAKLDQLKQDLARQPRIRRLTSVSTRASYDAYYLNSWAEKIEAVGNNNFPTAALENAIFGNLRLSVMLLPNGAVDKIEILQSSGHSILDEAAKNIVRLASPFEAFPKEIRSNTDKLEIIRTWRFEITGLKTTN